MPPPTYPSREAFRWINRTLGGQCRLPVEILMVMYCLVDHRNVESGLSWPSRGKIAVETTLAEEQVAIAVRGAEQLQLITRRSLTLTGVIHWDINVGHTPPVEQMHLRHSVTSRIRQMGLTDRQQLCAEAAVRIGYDWISGEVVTTTSELAVELPHWPSMKLYNTLKELSRLGIMPVIKKGHGKRPARRDLVLDGRKVPGSHNPEVESSGFSQPGSLKVPGSHNPEVMRLPGSHNPEVASRVPYRKNNKKSENEDPPTPPHARPNNHHQQKSLRGSRNGTSERGTQHHTRGDGFDEWREAERRSMA